MTNPSEAVQPLLAARQTRRFTDAPLADGHLDAILEAARWSGSRENRQPWRFVVVRDADVRARLARAVDATSPLADSPAIVAIVLPKEEGAAISNAFDEGRATERIVVAATLLGLGAAIAWVGPDARSAVADLLGVPEGRFVRTLIGVGHPADDAGAERSRLPRDEVVLLERYED